MRERWRRAWSAWIILAAGSMASAASAPAVETVGFDEAVHRAVENNHDVARASDAILRAEALLDRARSVVLPTVEIDATESVIDSERSDQGIVFQPKEQLFLGVTVAVPVLAAADWASRAQAADQVEIARLEAAEVRRQISAAAAQAYLAVIAARRQVEVEERARDNALAQYDYARARLDAGAGSRLDAARAAEVLDTNEVLVERSRLALTLSRESLGVLLAADGPVNAGEEPVLIVPGEGELPGLSSRTDLRLRAKQREAADRVLRDSWKDWVPDIVATFDPLYVAPAGAFQEANTWRVALSARFPLYLGGERAADRRLRAAALEKAETNLHEAELRARSEVRSARAAVDAAERGLEHARAAAERADEALTITDKAFRAGARTNIELVDAQRRARDAETAAASAEDRLRQAKLELLVALGLFGTD